MIRRSLIDRAPSSLFDRARQGLSSAPPVPDRASSVPDWQAAPASAGSAGFGPAAAAVSGTTIRRLTEGGLPMHPQGANADTENPGPPSVSAALSPLEWAELVDLIVERIEDRVTDELARRGRLYPPGVF